LAPLLGHEVVDLVAALPQDGDDRPEPAHAGRLEEPGGEGRSQSTTRVGSMVWSTTASSSLLRVMPRLLWSPSTYCTEVSTVATRQLTAVHSMGIPSRHRYELRHNDERRSCDKPVK